MVKQMDEDLKILAYCDECESAITSDSDEYFCDDEGHYFCNCDCCLEYYGIHSLET